MAAREEETLKEESRKQEEHKMVKKTSPYDLNSNDDPVGTGRGKGRMEHANGVHIGGMGAETVISERDGSGLVGLTTEQWQTLVELLNGQKMKSNDKLTGECENNTWIIDTGASNHMTGNLNHMHELRDIQSCPVGLPNGQRTTAIREGSVVLDGGLKLTNVLYVPKLNCNLISVSQLMDELKCVIQFTDKLCVIQDRTSRMLIGAGERRDGLYFFKGIRRVRVHKTDGMHSIDLWHKRLGHPSLKITGLIPEVSKHKDSSVMNKTCEICFRAKQTRGKFPLSEHKASEAFELIHCDLWGPYSTSSTCGAFYFLTIVDDYSRAVWIYT